MKRIREGTQKRKSLKKKNLGKYKSGLEKTCADMLSESRIGFFYEEQNFILVEKFMFAGTYLKSTPKGKDLSDRSNKTVLPIKYTPDFVAKDGSWIIETKGFVPSHHDFPMRWKLFMKYIVENYDPAPALFICKNKHQIEQAISKIKSLNGTTADKGRTRD